jgi:voltage-gated potassium channel
MPLLVLTSLRAIWTLRREPQFVSLAFLAAVAIVSGTGFYTLVEGLRFVDAFYFSVVTLTTVGYGDFAPQTDVGKLFTAVYVLVGVGILLAFVTTVAAKVSQTPLLHQPKGRPTRDDDGSCLRPPTRLAANAAQDTQEIW